MAYLGELSALFTATLWSGSSLAFSAAVVRVGSVQVNITRLMMACLLLGATVLVLGFDLSVSGSQILNLCLSGLAGLVLGDSFLFKAYQEVGARISMLIMSIAPALSAFLAYLFLGESLSLLGILGIVVTLSGIALVVVERGSPGGPTHRIISSGVMYAFLAALGQAVGLIFAKEAFLEADLNAMVATLVRVLFAAIVLLPVMTAARRYRNPFTVYRRDRSALGFTTLGAILGPFLGITFSLIAVANTKVGIAATLMAMPPIIMLPMVKVFQKEVLNWKAIVGAFVSVAGVAILFLR